MVVVKLVRWSRGKNGEDIRLETANCLKNREKMFMIAPEAIDLEKY